MGGVSADGEEQLKERSVCDAVVVAVSRAPVFSAYWMTNRNALTVVSATPIAEIGLRNAAARRGRTRWLGYFFFKLSMYATTASRSVQRRRPLSGTSAPPPKANHVRHPHHRQAARRPSGFAPAK